MRSAILVLTALLLGLSKLQVGASPSAEAGTDTPALSEGEVGFCVDTAAFRASGGSVLLEVYLLLPAEALSFSRNGGDSLTAEYKVEVLVPGAAADTAVFERFARRTYLTTTEEAGGAPAVVDVFTTALPSGSRSLTVTVRDEDSGRKGECAIGLRPLEGSADALGLSDIQIGTQIEAASGAGRFVKNGIQVTPNVMRRVLGESPTLHAYFEVYNLASGSGETGRTFRLYYSVLDAKGSEVKALAGRRVAKPGASCVKSESFDLAGVPAGTYDLVVMVKDDMTGRTATQKRSFTVLPVGQSDAAVLEEAALQRSIDGMKYLASQEEIDACARLGGDAKQAFVREFWKAKDPTPQTQENEFALEHFRRIRDADAQLAYGRKKGSDTDRGRVYVLYGPPSEIQREATRAFGKAYEIWTYQVSGRYEFVFIDRRGNGAFELVHSTMPGERYNPEWEDDRWDETAPGLRSR